MASNWDLSEDDWVEAADEALDFVEDADARGLIPVSLRRTVSARAEKGAERRTGVEGMGCLLQLSDLSGVAAEVFLAVASGCAEGDNRSDGHPRTAALLRQIRFGLRDAPQAHAADSCRVALPCRFGGRQRA